MREAVSRAAPPTFIFAFVVVVGALAFPAHAWEEIHRVDGIRVYSQDRAGSAYEELKATATIDVPVDVAFAIVTEPKLFLALIPNLTTSDVLGRPKANCVRMYQRFNAPFPLADRDYIIDLCKTTLKRKGKTVHRLTWTDAVDARRPPVKRVVRVKKTEGYWELTARGRTKTDAEYYVFADLGGRVPSSLVNQVSAYELPAVIENLVTIANKRKSMK